MNSNDRIYIRVSSELKEQLQHAADDEGRSLTNYILNVLKNHLRDDAAKE